MNVVYKIYEPNQGLEEIQAKIYNQATHRDVTGEEIRQRFEREKIDPKTVRYAFTEEDEPLAYIQARDYPQIGEILLGYPWALPDCPLDVQEKLFNDLYEYIIGKESDLKMKVTVANEEKYLYFIKQKPFEQEAEFYQFNVDIKDGINLDTNDLNYSIRLATKEDYDYLVNEFVQAFFNGDETQKNRAVNFIDRGMAREVFYVMQQNDILVGGAGLIFPNTALDKASPDYLRFNPLFTCPGYEDSILLLIQKSCEFSLANNWGKKALQVPLRDTDIADIKILKSIPHTQVVNAVKFGLTFQ